MPKYQVSVFCTVNACCDMTIEADSVEEAKAKALEQEREAFKGGTDAKRHQAELRGIDYDVQWTGAADFEVNECYEVKDEPEADAAAPAKEPEPEPKF
jgi:hypothetical protein